VEASTGAAAAADLCGPHHQRAATTLRRRRDSQSSAATSRVPADLLTAFSHVSAPAQTRLELWGHGMGGATIGPEEDMTPPLSDAGGDRGDIILE